MDVALWLLLGLAVASLLIMGASYWGKRKADKDFGAWGSDHASDIVEVAGIACKAVALIAGIILLVICGSMFAARFAHGHDDASWIQANPDYRDRAGIHCCSPDHCLPVQRGEIQRIPGGWLHVPTSTAIMDGEPGIYPSERAIPFRCVWGGALKCLFPATGA